LVSAVLAMKAIVMHARRTVLIPLIAIGFIVLLPAIIPVAIVLNLLQKFRMRKAAKTFKCIKCGRELGIASLHRADHVWSNYVRELTRNDPGVRLRLLRSVHAICLGCNTWYRFHKKDRLFVVEEPWPSGERAP